MLGVRPDLSDFIKNGILYLEDPVDREWNPHFFALTKSKMFYSFERCDQNSEGGDDEEEEDMASIRVREVFICSCVNMDDIFATIPYND